MRRSLVLLTYNEIDGLRAVVPNLPVTAVDEIIAVDWASTDGTREFLGENGIRVIAQTRRGRGEAFRIALGESRGDFIVFFSPDGNEDPSDIIRLFRTLEQGADMVIASRFLPGGRNEEDDSRMPLRKWANQAFTAVANMIWNEGEYLTDSINGFRGVTRKAFGSLLPESTGYTIEYEMSIRAMKQKLRIAEFPTREGQRIGGRTKGPSLAIGPSFLTLLFREVRRGSS